MTVPSSIDPARLIEEQLVQASPDLLRELLQTFINTLLSAEADSVCGAEYGTTSPERTNRRNGYRHRDFDTRAGTLDVAVPTLGEGTYFPEWLLQRRRRAEQALTSVVATCYLLGVSTRRMDKLVQSLGITGLSKSQVSTMAADLPGSDQGMDRHDPAALADLQHQRVGGHEGVTVGEGAGCGTAPRGCRSTPTGTERSSACTSPPARTGPAGWPSGGT